MLTPVNMWFCFSKTSHMPTFVGTSSISLRLFSTAQRKGLRALLRFCWLSGTHLLAFTRFQSGYFRKSVTCITHFGFLGKLLNTEPSPRLRIWPLGWFRPNIWNRAAKHPARFLPLNFLRGSVKLASLLETVTASNPAAAQSPEPAWRLREVPTASPGLKQSTRWQVLLGD